MRLGNNEAGSSNPCEQERLERKSRLAALNIPEIVKSMEQECRPKKAIKKKQGTSVAASSPPKLRPKPQRKNAQPEKEPVLDDLQPVGNFLTDNGGNNEDLSSNPYEQERLENIEMIKKTMASLNIPQIAKSITQQGRLKKATKKKHGTSVAASSPPKLRPRPQRNNAQLEKAPVVDDLQPVGDFLTDNVEEIQDNETIINEKAGRGITMLDEVFSRTPEMPKIKVSLNEHGQPVEKTGRQFASAVGCHVRKKLSIAHDDWRLIPIETKLELWKDLKAFYDIDDAALNWFLSSAWTKWKQFKSDLKKKYFDPEVSIDEIPECPDKRVNDNDWQYIYNHWMSSTFQERSNTAKVNRDKRKCYHTCGSVSYACSDYDLSLKLGRPPRRDENYIKTHTRKNGVPLPQAQDTISTIQLVVERYPELTERTIQEGDLFSIVCREKEPKGYVRCMGLGPTPQDIGTPGLKSYKPTRLQMENLARMRAESEKTALQQEVLQLQAQIEEIKQKNRASEEPMSHHGSTSRKKSIGNDEYQNEEDAASGQGEDGFFCDQMEVANTSKAGAKITTTPRTNDAPWPKHDALVGKDVILYGLMRTNLPVGKGTIISTNPETIVGGEPLGRQYCEVVVSCVLKRDAILPRPYGKMEVMANTTMRSIAWPYKKLKFAKKAPVASGHREAIG